MVSLPYLTAPHRAAQNPAVPNNEYEILTLPRQAVHQPASQYNTLLSHAVNMNSLPCPAQLYCAQPYVALHDPACLARPNEYDVPYLTAQNPAMQQLTVPYRAPQ